MNRFRRGGAKDCRACGKAFTAWNRSTRYCSRACLSAGLRAKRPTRTCAVCREPYSDRHVYDKLTCSVKCGRVLRRQRAERPCPVCGTPRLVSQLRKFCSVKCWRMQQTRDQTSECLQCGKPFKRHRTTGRQYRHGRFCSQACWVFYYRGNRSPMYRGGREEGRGKGWVARAESIRRRDGHVCQRCGKTQAENKRKLCVDHIIPWRLFTDAEKERANAPDNLVSLCGRCHSWKTAQAEQKYLRGDMLDFQQYERAIRLDSAARLQGASTC